MKLNSEKCLDHTNSMISEIPDPTTYHLFEYRGDRLLFDIKTGLLVELNNFAYDFLVFCRKYHDVSKLRDAFEKKYPSVSLDDALKAIDVLRNQGLFGFPRAFTTEERDKYIEQLWNHHPRRLQLVVAQHCNLKCIYCYMENNESN